MLLNDRKSTSTPNGCYRLVTSSKPKTHLHIDKPIAAAKYTIKMVAPVQDSTLFGDPKELAGGNAGELDRVKSQKGKLDLRIVEADFMRSVNP